ncbi:MAG: hypothetical protein RID07_10415 [Lacipirellulaceae bacterium]
MPAKQTEELLAVLKLSKPREPRRTVLTASSNITASNIGTRKYAWNPLVKPFVGSKENVRDTERIAKPIPKITKRVQGYSGQLHGVPFSLTLVAPLRAAGINKTRLPATTVGNAIVHQAKGVN